MESQVQRAAGARPGARSRRRLIRAGAAVATAAYVAPSMRTIEVAEAACNVSFGLDVEVAGCMMPSSSTYIITGHIRLDNCFPAPVRIDSLSLVFKDGQGNPISPTTGPNFGNPNPYTPSCGLLAVNSEVPARGCATVQFTASVGFSNNSPIIASVTVCGTPQGSGQQSCGNGGAQIGLCSA